MFLATKIVLAQMRVKPKAQRIEMTLPMDTRSENYHYGIDEALRINQLTLRSRPSELASTVAMGVFRYVKNNALQQLAVVLSKRIEHLRTNCCEI